MRKEVDKSDKNMSWVKVVLSYILVFFAMGLTTVSLFLPPRGEISETVLLILPQILIFVGVMLGVKYESHAASARASEQIISVIESYFSSKSKKKTKDKEITAE